MKKINKFEIEDFCDYIGKMDVTYTVDRDRNPSPEKIARIKAQIEKNKSRGL